MSMTSKSTLFGLLSAVLTLWLAVTSRPADAQLINLQSLGIDGGFEQPALGGNDDAETTSAGNLGPGWSFNEIAGEISNWGVADPGVGFFPRVAETPGLDDLAAPFAGRQIGFINLGDPGFSKAEAVSRSVGKLLANNNYTLTVAVGTRQNQAAWSVDYEIGLRTTGGVDLGTFAFLNRAGTDPATDLVYNLNIGASHPNIGEEINIVIRNSNAAAATGFSQGNFDNVRLQGAFGAANTPFLTINRATGGITLSKTGSDNLTIKGYSLTSDSGTLNGSSWTKVGGTWSTVANAADDLSEAQLTGGSSLTLSSGTPRSFGAAWRRTPFEDVQAELLLSDGSLLSAVVQYTGAVIPSGDLTGDGAISQADWAAFKAGQGAVFTGLLPAQAYLLGDFDNDFDHDLSDFIAFRSAYDNANGAGAFVAMAAAVPEPTSFVMLACGLAAASIVLRKQRQLTLRGVLSRQGDPFHDVQGIRFRMSSLVTAIVIACGLLTGLNRAEAQVIGPISIPNFSFQDPIITPDGNPDDEDAFDTDPGSPLGWTYSYTASPPGTESYGVQRPDPQSHFTRDVTGGETSPFVAPFNGDQIGFINLNNDAATAAQVDSGVLGVLAAGTYTLNFAVGGRNTGSWRDLDYTIGLVGTTSGPLGTPTLQRIDPGNAAGNVPFVGGVANDFNVVDLQYSLTVPSGSDLIGQDYFIRLTVANTGMNGTGAFTQAAFDNARLTGPTVPLFGLYVDEGSGQVQLRNPTGAPVDLSSYRITSGSDSLNKAGWKSIASQSLGAFPAGNGSGNGWEAGQQTDDGELVEWFLQGESTLPAGGFLDLGMAYDAVQNAKDLSFQYVNANGVVTSGLVFYNSIVPGDFDFDSDVDSADLAKWKADFGAFRNGNDFLIWQRNFGAAAPAAVTTTGVPEPASVWLLLCASAAFVRGSRQFRSRGEHMIVGKSVFKLSLIGVLVALCSSLISTAAVTVDREYRFGDDNAEGAVVSGAVGAGNSFGTTFDGSNVAGFRDLVPEGGPTYIDVGATGLARPGAPAGAKGIELSGSNYLRGLRFNAPATAAGSTGAVAPTPSGSQDYAGITNRGFQLWVKPSQIALDGTTDQYVVHDTTEHGLKIDGDNSWIMIYDGGEHDSGVAATADWTHVMVVRPNGGQNNFGGSLLYINGVAVEGEGGPYDLTPEPVGELEYVLTIGTDSGNGQSDGIDDGNQRFSGVVDDLTLFAMGTTTNGLNLGTFNFGQNNGWALAHLTGVAGDVDQNGVLDPVADVNALIGGWGEEKRVDGILAGDMTTILQGDLNFDGVTNLADAFAMNQALLAAGFSAGLDFSLLNGAAVPEPATATLFGLLVTASVLGARRRC